MTAVLTPKTKSRFYWNQDDTEIIKFFTEYYYLQLAHLHQLTGRNPISLRRRLRQLHEHGYLKRLRLPREQEIDDWYPTQYVYYLSQKGVNHAQHYGFADETWGANPEKSTLILPHDVLITVYHLALTLAIRNDPRLALTFFEQRRGELQDWVEHEGEKLSVNPDWFFTLKNAAKPAAQTTSHFFLEMIRARESDYQRGESYLIRKMRAYSAYWQHGKHTETWGIYNFRVITVVPTPERAANLCEKLAANNLGFERFWISDYSRCLSLQDPGRALQKIYMTPKDYRNGVLYSFLD